MTPAPTWRTSSHSGSGGGQCAQVGAVPGAVLVRDSNDYDGPSMAFDPQAWRAFAARVKVDANPPN
jgi:hypothetical protein